MVKGNLCTKPLRTSECDDENRLTAVTLEEDWRTTFVHDGVGRLRQRQERTWQFVDPPGIYVWGAQAGVYCVYDDKRVIQERDAASTPTVSYTRGLDLSGGLQGAGGIGGLLALSQLSTPDSQHFYYHSDGNGNVTCLITTNQLIAAGYLYDPFGNTLSISGPRAFVNRYRFSSKPAHDVSAACDFLYRWYVPALQKWSNRDPLGEAGAKNLHAFAYNNPLSQLDPMGLSSEIGLPAEVLAEAEAGISPEQIAQDFNIALTRVLAIIAASAAAKAVQEVSTTPKGMRRAKTRARRPRMRSVKWERGLNLSKGSSRSTKAGLTIRNPPPAEAWLPAARESRGGSTTGLATLRKLRETSKNRKTRLRFWRRLSMRPANAGTNPGHGSDERAKIQPNSRRASAHGGKGGTGRVHPKGKRWGFRRRSPPRHGGRLRTGALSPLLGVAL